MKWLWFVTTALLRVYLGYVFLLSSRQTPNTTAFPLPLGLRPLLIALETSSIS